MSLTKNRAALQKELEVILGDISVPLTGVMLSRALATFSSGILPPTIGIFTGFIPAALAYDSAPAFAKTKGIQDAINTFASFNASGMAPFSFTGTAPPKIKNLQILFDIVRDNSGTVEDIAKALSYAILGNYTLGRSVFTPLSITIPSWNVPLPSAVSNEMDQSAVDAKMLAASKQVAAIAEIERGEGLEQDSFFDRMTGNT
tara:strand:- start:49 stop:654 length:606 start_codon:yes stop_codon:yes gene_type:complete